MKGTYEHSGAVGLGPALLPALGIPSVIILGLMYSYAMVYSPFVILNLLIICAYGFGLSFVMVLVGKASKCRSVPLLMLMGLAIGVFALYAEWAAFESALISKISEDGDHVAGFFDRLLNPEGMWAFALLINENGWRSISGTTPTGLVLWITWGIEAVIVVGATTLGAVGSIADEVFCEECGQWCEDHSHVLLTFPEDDAAFERVVEGDINALTALDPPFEGQPAYLQVELKQCVECRLMATYQVKVVKHGSDDEGNPTVETTAVSPQCLVESEGFARLSALADRPFPDLPTEGV